MIQVSIEVAAEVNKNPTEVCDDPQQQLELVFNSNATTLAADASDHTATQNQTPQTI